MSENLTSHFFPLALSPSYLVLVCRSTPNVSTLVAKITPLLLHSRNFCPDTCRKLSLCSCLLCFLQYAAASNPFSSTSFFNVSKTFCANSANSLFLPFKRSVRSSTKTFNFRADRFLSPHSQRSATQCAGASNSTLTHVEWPRRSGAAPPHILQTEHAASERT